MIRQFIKSVLRKLGFKIQRIPNNKINYEFTMVGALQRSTERGLNVKTVIDVGASDGRWSKICMNFQPSAKYLLIEAQEEHKKGLDRFILDNKNADYIIAAAGRREGYIYFDNSNLFGGLASESPFEKNCIQVPLVSIDAEVDKRNLEPPYLIKLDTHGFEVPILEGSMKTIKQAELIIIESYNYRLTNESLRYFEMCNYMEKIGFSPIENVDFTLRKYDNSFWQMDTFFIPSDRKEFSYNAYI